MNHKNTKKSCLAILAKTLLRDSFFSTIIITLYVEAIIERKQSVDAITFFISNEKVVDKATTNNYNLIDFILLIHSFKYIYIYIFPL